MIRVNFSLKSLKLIANKPTEKSAKLKISFLCSQPKNMLWILKRDSSSFVCFVALRPKSTAMVMAGRSVQLTTLLPGQA